MHHRLAFVILRLGVKSTPPIVLHVGLLDEAELSPLLLGHLLDGCLLVSLHYKLEVNLIDLQPLTYDYFLLFMHLFEFLQFKFHELPRRQEL